MTFDDDTFDDDTDPLVARLRAALTAEADMVNPTDDGLRSIRSRTAERSRWAHPAVLATAAAVVLGLLIGGGAALLGGGDGGRDSGADVVAEQPTTTTTPETASPTSSEATTTSEATDTALDRTNVWVYYVMDDPDSGPRLYRERHSVAAGPPSAAAAVQEMFSGPAQDPDYVSPWPTSTRITGYSTSGDTATVDLSTFTAGGAQYELLAVQQLVYTVTANDPAVRQVQVLVDGDAPESGHSDWSEPVRRAPMVDVQGLIWLLSPAEGAAVESPVKVEGYGTAFEGTVSWEVRREGSGEVVAEGFTQAGANGEFDEFRDTVALEPGTYEIRAFESSAEDGRPLHVDDKTFTVR